MCTHYCVSKHLFTPDYATCMTATETLRLNKMREIYKLSSNELMSFFSHRAQMKLIALQKTKACVCSASYCVNCLISAAPVLCHTHGSNIVALVPGLPCFPLLEVHVDIGGYKVIHLVALLEGDRDAKKMNKKSNTL